MCIIIAEDFTLMIIENLEYIVKYGDKYWKMFRVCVHVLYVKSNESNIE
jgi:hypothetical protein